jgi:hypothetical protein
MLKRIMIYLRRFFRRLYFCMVKYLRFDKSSFALRCFSMQGDSVGIRLVAQGSTLCEVSAYFGKGKGHFP